MLKYLFYLVVATLSLGQFSAIFKSGDSSIYLFDLVVIAFAVYGLFYFLSIKSLRVPFEHFALLVFAGVAVISLLRVATNFSSDALIVGGFYIVRLLAYIGAGLVIYNMVKSNLISLEQLVTALIYSCVFISVCGFIQLIVLPDFTTLDASLGWDPHKNRLASTFFDPNFVGAYLCLGLGALVEKFFIDKSFTKIDVFWFLLILAAELLTFSRSAWVMFGAIILVYGLLRSRLMLGVALLVMFSAYFAVPRIQTRISGATDPADSAQFRMISWANAWTITKDSPALGAGFNLYRYVQQDYGFLDAATVEAHSGAGADSSLLFILATTGFIGGALYLISFSNLLSSKNVFVLAILLGLFLESLFINSLFYPQIMLWLFVLPVFVRPVLKTHF